jgi:Mn2+/Fe2+ NRAMP family transporter
VSKGNSIIQKLGPGLLYAGAAIGVSHLVQSTRAGASFGISMIIVVVLANILKFPFFQYGPRYVTATGKSLLHGYKKLGNWAIWLFFIMTLGTMFIIQGAITMVTAGLAKYITNIDLPLNYWIIIILVLSTTLLISGKTKVLDTFMKVVMVILTITTVGAAISSIFAYVNQTEITNSFSFSNQENLFFLIAFIGWMPAPIDISVWYSVWSETKQKNSSHKTSLKDSLFDFSVGYWGTAILALCFVVLGAFMLHNTGIELSPSAVVFSGQIIDAYTQSLGSWSTPIISIAAFTTMFSTTVSVLDGISRVMISSWNYLSTPVNEIDTIQKKSTYNHYMGWLISLGIGSYLLIIFYAHNMKQLVDFATTISFLTAPVLAYLNIRVMQSTEISEEYKPNDLTRIISYIGLVVLIVFSVIFIFYKLV